MDADAIHARLLQFGKSNGMTGPADVMPSFTIQLLATDVLTKIGDVRALPVLNSLLNTNAMTDSTPSVSREYFLQHIQYCIEEVQKKNNMR